MGQGLQLQAIIPAGIAVKRPAAGVGASRTRSAASLAFRELAGPTLQPASQHHFEIHREDRVSVTSTLFCGGDWRWALRASTGGVLAEAGGYSSEAACLAAITALRGHSASALVVRTTQAAYS